MSSLNALYQTQSMRPVQFIVILHQDLQELQQQLLEAAKDKKEVTSIDLGGKCFLHYSSKHFLWLFENRNISTLSKRTFQV